MRIPRFRRVAVAAAAAAALVPAHGAFPATRTRSTSSLATLRSAVLIDLNLVRAAHGLRPLRLNLDLSAAAAQHTDEMLQDGYFSHSSLDGTSFWRRIARFYPAVHYRIWTVGENLLWTGRRLSAVGALKMWMASPEHRANILRPGWREVGIAVQFERNAPGAFEDTNATVVAADFGARH